jgi:hypothetical protein
MVEMHPGPCPEQGTRFLPGSKDTGLPRDLICEQGDLHANTYHTAYQAEEVDQSAVGGMGTKNGPDVLFRLPCSDFCSVLAL